MLVYCLASIVKETQAKSRCSGLALGSLSLFSLFSLLRMVMDSLEDIGTVEPGEPDLKERDEPSASQEWEGSSLLMMMISTL